MTAAKPDIVATATALITEMKGENVACLSVSSMCSFTDWMVIATGRSSRHVIAMAEKIAFAYKQHCGQMPHIEGLDAGEWALVDCDSFIVHIMQSESREHYALEKLWG